jgi:uncharacterized membrane protein
MTNSQITLAARNHLDGKWLPSVLAFFIAAILPYLITNSISKDSVLQIPIYQWGTSDLEIVHFNTANILTGLIGGALSFGQAFFSLNLIREEKAEIEHIFKGFKDLNHFFVCFATSIILGIFILLWTLLLIIPGIIAALSYSMTYFILADHPTIGSLEAINQSKVLMKGHKWQLFKLYLRFIGLGLLCVLTLGIGFFWLVPYANICLAEFYESLIAENE